MLQEALRPRDRGKREIGKGRDGNERRERGREGGAGELRGKWFWTGIVINHTLFPYLFLHAQYSYYNNKKLEFDITHSTSTSLQLTWSTVSVHTTFYVHQSVQYISLSICSTLVPWFHFFLLKPKKY